MTRRRAIILALAAAALLLWLFLLAEAACGCEGHASGPLYVLCPFTGDAKAVVHVWRLP